MLNIYYGRESIDKEKFIYEKIAEKKGMDIEVLFHPGFLNSDEADFKNKNIVFESFYFSENRKCEFETAMKISERSGL